MAAGIAVEGMESLAPVLVDGMELLVDLMPARHHRAGARPRARPQPGRTTWSRRARSSSARRGRPRRAAARRRSTSAPRPTARSPTCAQHAIGLGHAWWSVSPFGIDTDDVRRRPRDAQTAGVPSRTLPDPPRRGLPRRPASRRSTDIRGWLDESVEVVGRARRPRPGPALRRAARRARHRRPAGRGGRRAPGPASSP